MLGIPTIYDRVCQQALLNRLEPIFEPIFDDASFGYRRGRSTKDALRKVWKEIRSGSEWIAEEANPWEAQVARSDVAARKLNLDEGLWKILREPSREIIVHIPVQIDEGTLESFTGFRVQHSIGRGPAKGGIRYGPNVTLDETRALASW